MRNPSVICVLLCACSGGGKATSVGDLVEVRVEPSTASLTTTSELSATEDFRVVASFKNGSEDDDYPLVEWSLSNTAAGTVDTEGLFTTSLTNGGTTTLIANAHGIEAYAEITVTYEEEVEDNGLDPSAHEVFEGTASPATTELSWAYPEDGVSLPKNLPEFTFMWNDAVGASLYRLTLTSETTHVSIVTDQTSYTAPSDLWKIITATNAGGEVVVSLESAVGTVSGGTMASADALYAADDITFKVNRFDAQGAVYYWSVAESGIVRSEVDEADPEVWFGPTAANAEWCVGCHVLSPDGDQMSFAWQIEGESSFRMSLGDLDEDSHPSIALELDATRDNGTFSTWSPDGNYVVFAFNGALYVYDGNTGDYLWEVESELDLTMPHWSPDGDALVAVSATKHFEQDTNFQGGELVVFPVDENGTFGEPWTLVEAEEGLNSYYPMYSPDGDWIVFNQATGTPYFNMDATLYIISKDGGTPIELANANQGEMLTNSWPRWGPIPDDDVLWLAYASTRDYGTAATEGVAHIWVSAIDTTLAEAGQDPSKPAFWLVQQEIGGSNHAPWWGVQ